MSSIDLRAAAGGLGRPVHRGLVAQQAEPLVRDAVEEGVGVGQVDRVERQSGGLGHGITVPRTLARQMSEPSESSHLLFVPSPQGYRLQEQHAELPQQGDEVEIEAGRFVVNRVGPSPYPLDPRRCAYLVRKP
jgi:hypothetical protein